MSVYRSALFDKKITQYFVGSMNDFPAKMEVNVLPCGTARDLCVTFSRSSLWNARGGKLDDGRWGITVLLGWNYLYWKEAQLRPIYLQLVLLGTRTDLSK